jgi:hypothetical protein
MQAKQRITTSVLGTVVVLAASGSTGSPSDPRHATQERLEQVARGVVSADATQRAQAVGFLREAGQPGLDALERTFAAQTAELRARPARLGQPLRPELDRLRSAYDRVAGQRDAHASRLRWHDELEGARAESARTGKPILSLRMLGELTAELSCANSRLFRVLLYPDPRVNALLRERFVLHWSSERAVPVVTIDLGDGRVLQETLTGNSIHYVLDQEGRVLDAIPGLWEPGAFATRLTESLEVWQRFGADAEGWRGHHRHKARASRAEPLLAMEAPPARNALPIAATKAVMEVPLIKDRGASLAPPADPGRDPAVLARAAGRLDDVRFSDLSLALIQRKLPPADAVGSTSLAEVVERLRERVAIDTVVNEDQLQPRLHRWLADAPRAELEGFNARVYASLFLTPRADPWIGLRGADTFLALEGGGVVAR